MWWRDRVAYQIWPRSFADSNGDGIGDLQGIIGKLHYLADLGIGIVWLSPVYASPMVDMGYDISDYRAIAPEFGTLDDMDRLIAEAAERGIRIVMDLVVNHSSDQHAWFRGNRAKEFYIWRDAAPDGGPPSDLRSYFGGSAWHWDTARGQYYLGLFSPGQPDLNWDSAEMRAEVYDMMNWWLDRGIAGFRMDVIDHIGKDIDAGVLTDGPRLHDHLQEMHREVFAGRDALTIGEAWSVTTKTAPLYVGRDRGELDMMFQFNHIVAGWDPDHGKWAPLPFDLVAFKKVWAEWQEALADDGWNALFLSNHDLPRQVSRYGDGSAASAKALALAMHLMKGTPFIYQGEELGMTNAGFTALDQYRDLETLNLFDEETARGVGAEDFLAGAAANGRDNARTPMRWDATEFGGFTSGTPWIGMGVDDGTRNTAAQAGDPGSVLSFYKALIALRRAQPVIVNGTFCALMPDDPQIMAYRRTDDTSELTVVVNLSPESAPCPELPLGKRLVATHGTTGSVLRPWEGVAILTNRR